MILVSRALQLPDLRKIYIYIKSGIFYKSMCPGAHICFSLLFLLCHERQTNVASMSRAQKREEPLLCLSKYMLQV